jgi:hypothetical protein
MTKLTKDNLFVLVKSLTKSEKRQFKLYVGRLGVNEDSKFLLLFKLLERLKAYDEKLILPRIRKKTTAFQFKSPFIQADTYKLKTESISSKFENTT